jgi:hypothetical protein
VKTPMGLSAPAVSVIMKAMCSGVWPGVCSTSTLILPTIQRVAIIDQHHIGIVGVGVFPVGVTHVAQVDGGAGGGSQFAAAADKVGVNVRLGDVGDAQPFLARRRAR